MTYCCHVPRGPGCEKVLGMEHRISNQPVIVSTLPRQVTLDTGAVFIKHFKEWIVPKKKFKLLPSGTFSLISIDKVYHKQKI